MVNRLGKKMFSSEKKKMYELRYFKQMLIWFVRWSWIDLFVFFALFLGLFRVQYLKSNWTVFQYQYNFNMDQNFLKSA